MTVIYPLQRSTPPRRRTSEWVGRSRIKLAERLDRQLAEMGYESEIDPSNIRPQQGAWRTNHSLDVMRLEGVIRLNGPVTLGAWRQLRLASWDTIGDMLRNGVEIEISPLVIEISAGASNPSS